MNKPLNRNFEDLVSKATSYLRDVLEFSESNIKKHRQGWGLIRKFMHHNSIEYFDKTIMDKMLPKDFTNKNRYKFPARIQKTHHAIRHLTEFQEHGKLFVRHFDTKYPLTFIGPFADIINDFLEYKKVECRLSWSTRRCYERGLYIASEYFAAKNIISIRDVKLSDIIQLFSEIKTIAEFPTILIIQTMRGFMKFAYEKNYTDRAVRIPKYRNIKQPKLPSTYTSEEIEILIDSIDRSTRLGKRDYAIILIAAKLGLRASDIALLKFESLNWESNVIEIKQFKTEKELVLPLLPDIGNAIIDYLKYVRTTSDSPYVFLREMSPRTARMSSAAVIHSIRKLFEKSGIKIKGRRSGSHSLRHSLASRMLEESVVLPVISEVLGHSNTESTKFYMRIDLKSMKLCMLEVPTVPLGFYSQKGGMFYE